MKCKKHPNYKAIRPPTSDCDSCKKQYRINLTELMKKRWAARKVLLKQRKQKKVNQKIDWRSVRKSIKKIKQNNKEALKTDMGEEAFKEMKINAQMLDKKHLDYGPGNIARFGLRGIVVRLNDKVERLATLTEEGKIQKAQFESIEDSLRDISNYATIGLLLQQGKWK